LRKILGVTLTLMMAVSLVLLPLPVSAEPPPGECTAGLDVGEFDPHPKWWDNENSRNLYLKHWGRTPIQAMSRLAGLSGPNIGTYIDCSNIGANSCYCGCPACRDEEPGNDPGACATCSDPVACNESLSGLACELVPDCQSDCPEQAVYKQATCCCCWGVSLAFANKSWAGCDIGSHPRVNNDTHPAHFGTSECYGGGTGGDWGNSGCPHTEHCAQTYCLQDNLCANPGVNN
jgi:hypothetical protein